MRGNKQTRRQRRGESEEEDENNEEAVGKHPPVTHGNWGTAAAAAKTTSCVGWENSETRKFTARKHRNGKLCSEAE